MKTNSMLKFLCSLPIIFLLLYFIPFLGVLLLIVRLITFRSSKKNLPIIFIIVGIILIIPSVIENVLKIIKVDISKIAFLNNIINSDLYKTDVFKYGRLLIILGVIYLIIYTLVNRALQKSQNFLVNYINKQEQMQRAVYQKNDMIMQEKREKSLHTKAVKCPYCGGDNIIDTQIAKCKYCRRTIS